ncbi:calcium-binding protein [Marinovum sp. 2_MG-2023]|uniref:calcium-binding protein n=1 Tax=unclassified Marinovum TaxID=2647166 RepID=UPI0026E15D71|nr:MULTISPECIES: calcium-binding protein [unclassified Marinovum]MDO6733009.1 calcium-binding protein [Marinovum sp. 2_MG-2023]MDO6782273.1 calcium-binding protein [Marinovum sp. 1_MG-2023]
MTETTDAAADSSTSYELSKLADGASNGTQTILGSVDVVGDEDWVNFGIVGGRVWIVEVEGTGADPLGDPLIEIVDASGTPLPTSSYFATQISATKKIYQFTSAQNGNEAFIRVTSTSGAETGDYLVTYYQGARYDEGTDGSDRPTLNQNASLYYGFGGDDFIRGQGPGDDTIFAGDGRDTVRGAEGDDRIFGEAGNDRINASQGDDRAMGGTGNDTVIGQLGDDTLFGGAGNDHLLSGAGDDVMLGGAGHDRLEAWEGSDLLKGGDGADTLFGSYGNDTLIGGAGADDMRGGDGFDLADYSSSGQGMVLNLSDQVANSGAAAGDVLTSLEVIRGTVFDDAITGNQFRNVLKGNNGDDTLEGAGGNDRLIGGAGADDLTGGTGNDSMTGGAGPDTFVFIAGDGADQITDFLAAEDVLRFAAGTTVTVTDDGTDTTVSYGSDSVVLEGVVLAQGDITFEFV